MVDVVHRSVGRRQLTLIYRRDDDLRNLNGRSFRKPRVWYVTRDAGQRLALGEVDVAGHWVRVGVRLSSLGVRAT